MHVKSVAWKNFHAADFLYGKIGNNKEKPADASADERAVHANPQEILLDLIVDEPIELIVRQPCEHILNDDADERLRMERGAREQVVQNLCDDLLQIGALLDEGKHVPIFHPDDAAQMCIEFWHMLFNGVHMSCTILLWRAVRRDLVERRADMALNEGGTLFQIDGIRQLEETREKSIP